MERFGKYELLDRVGAGGMAEIYCARTAGSSELIALKRIRPQYADEPDFIDMFLDEARTHASLRHPNIVDILELGTIEGSYFIATELVRGCSLRQLLNLVLKGDRGMSVAVALFITKQAAAGLTFAHESRDAAGQPRNIVHRDVSPQNILISTEGEVKIIDFGVAKAIHCLSSTKAGGLKGKFGYMAPEQARGEVVDHRTDLFALGSILHEMVTGKRLYGCATDIEIMYLVQTGPAEFATAESHGISLPVEHILRRCLAPDREERYSSGRQMVADLDQFLAVLEQPPVKELSALVSEVMGDRVRARKRTESFCVESEKPTVAAAAGSQRRRPPSGVPMPPPPVVAWRRYGSEPNDSHVCVVQIRGDEDILRARRAAQTVAGTLKMRAPDGVALATVASELSRVALRKAGSGELRIEMLSTPSPCISIELLTPLVADGESCLSPKKLHSPGLVLAERLVDELIIDETSSHQIIVSAIKYL